MTDLQIPPKTGRGRGRVSKINDLTDRKGQGGEMLSVAEAIVLAIRGSNTHQTAAEWAGVSPATLSVWLSRGTDELTEMAKSGRETPEDDKRDYVNLVLDVRQAEADSEVTLVTDMRRHSKKNYLATGYLLAHRHGGPWQQQQQRIGVDITATTIGAAAMSHDEAHQLDSELRRRHAEQQAALDPVLDVSEVEDV